MTAFRMARQMPMLMTSYSPVFPVVSMKYCSGIADVVKAARLGAPMIVAAKGTNSASTVMTSDQRIARAMLRRGPAVSSEKFTALAYPLYEKTATAVRARMPENATGTRAPWAPPITGWASALQFLACENPSTVRMSRAASSMARKTPVRTALKRIFRTATPAAMIMITAPT